MKKVAATSGHRVSLAALVFALGIAREGSWAGSDNVLNFYSRSSLERTLTFAERSNFAIEEYKVRPAAQEKNASPTNFFSTLTDLQHCARLSSRPPADNKPAFPPVLPPPRLFSLHLRPRTPPPLNLL